MPNRNTLKLTGDPVTYPIPSPAAGVQLETFIPWTLVKRGAKKEVITPLDAPEAFRPEVERAQNDEISDTALLRALGLAYHWQRLLDGQWVASVPEIAAAEGTDVTYVRRLLRLTLLTPSIVQRLLGNSGAALDEVLRPSWPSDWPAQERKFRQGS